MDVIVKYPRNFVKLSEDIQDILALLVCDLKKYHGKPLNCGWKNCGPLKQLGSNYYHCHLNRSTVAVWKIEDDKTSITCYITYAGTREKAPY